MKNKIFTLALVLSLTLTGRIFGQNVGIGESNPGSKLSVKGGMSVGSTYSTLTGPTGGIIIEGVMGLGTTSPDSNAILEIASTSKGIKFPRLTQAQRNAIHNPSKGLMLFDTDSNNVYYNDGTSWQSMVNLTQVTSLISGLTSTVNGLLGGGGTTGSTWYNGSASPTILTTGNTGDYYLATSTGNYYKKTTLGWTLQGNLMGPTGSAGSAGAAGATGAKGATGANGTNGTNGATGATGAAGAAGSNGSNGAAGATGAAGAQGIQGVTGVAGAAGAAGAVGATGAKGATGSNGVTGAAGTNGTNGSNGAVGATGAQGIQGIQGVTGAAGSNGTNGTNGSNGAVGATGAQGAQGIQGIQGVTGAAGSNGTNGTNGAAGATGAQGAQGIQGIQGVTGAAGAAGAVGATGAKGATGANGATGSNGTNGTNGATGATGAQGITGPTGSATGGWLVTGNSINAGTNFIGTTNNASFRVKTNNTERLTVDSTGNVGINTTTPDKALKVISNTAGVNVVTLQSTSSTGWTSIDYYDNNNNMSFTTGYANSGTGSFFGGNAYLNTYGNDLIITNNSSTYDMYMNGSTGNIGIGTGTPQNKLDVNGGIAVGTYAGSAGLTNGILVSGDVGIGTNGDYAPLTVQASGGKPAMLGGGSTTGSELKLDYAGAQHFSIYNNGQTNANGNNYLTFANTSAIAGTNTSGSSIMVLEDDGSVGIGTISPQSALDVNGGVSVGSYAGLHASPTNGMIISGSVGIGNSSPTSLLSVGSSSQFQVNSSGNIVKLNNVTTSFPSSQGAASTYLKNDGSGNLSWTTLNGAVFFTRLNYTVPSNSYTYNNINPSGATFLKFKASGTYNFNISGITAGTDGQMMVLYNTSAGSMTLQGLNSNSSSANQMWVVAPGGSAGNSNQVIPSGGSALLIYDGDNSKWNVVSYLH